VDESEFKTPLDWSSYTPSDSGTTLKYEWQFWKDIFFLGGWTLVFFLVTAALVYSWLN
jgi:hypothetical protein